MTAGDAKTSNREFGEYDSDADERGVDFHKDGEYERIRENARERLKELARPRQPYIESHTCVGPKVHWGTQEMMWPVSPRALRGRASPRVTYLATPKKNFQEGTEFAHRPMFFYSAGRPSVIWTVSEGAQQGSATERVQFLSQHKQFHPDWREDKRQFVYGCGRESPVWAVSRSAQQCEERPRTTALAEHRPYHPDFKPERPIQSIVTEPARNARCTDHVSSLANPKKRVPGPFRHPQWPVTEQAKTAVASSRCMELARSKPLAEGFQLAREVEWPVTKAAKRAQASGRVIELATPITRASMDHVQFNPEAFIVKESALKGVIPGRIQDLAEPIKR
nr:hypothetical protein BaRGS_029227 [Batillaria attramentaria]